MSYDLRARFLKTVVVTTSENWSNMLTKLANFTFYTFILVLNTSLRLRIF